MPTIVVGAPVLSLNSTEQNINLSGYLSLYVDTTKTLTFEQIQSPEFASQFKPNPHRVPNFGLTSDAIWARFSVVNNTDKNLSRLLQIAYPILDSIIIYKRDAKGHVDKVISGDTLPFSARDRDYRHFIFEIDIPQHQQQTIYLRIESLGSIQLPMSLLTAKQFTNQVVKQQFTFGIYYGLVIGLILYNLLLYLTISDKSYLYYVLYNSSALGLYSWLQGFSYQLLWPNNTWLANHIGTFFAGFLTYFLLQFTRVFLGIDERNPGQIKGYQALSVWCVLVILATFMSDYGLATKLALPLLAVTLAFIFCSAATSFLNGFRPARFYLIAFTVLIFGAIIVVGNRLGYFPTNPLTEHGFLFGSALEVILLSLALADRLNQISKQRKQALQKQLEATEQTVRLAETFKKFVPHAFLRYLNKQSINDVKLGDGVEKNMSILFSDVRAFTSLSESKTPSEIFHFMNNYLTIVGPVVRKNHGFIDKYIGDAIMALFDRSPQDAVSAGINMLKTLENYNRELTKKGIADIRIGIGLNTGPVMIGTLGEANRMESTVISDAVNLAARLEGLTKVYGVSFLISQQTFEQLECPEQFNTRIIDNVTVKGRKEAVLIYEVFDGDPLPMVAGKRTIKTQFEKAWHLYQNMAFEDALTNFKQCQQKYPEDNVTCLYIEKCQTLLSSDLPDQWDGITHIN